MGVKGLGGFATRIRRTVATDILLPFWTNEDGVTGATGGDGRQRTALVIDGWAFIFWVYMGFCSEWHKGGDYARYEELVKDIVASWIAVGLRPIFIFDGPTPPLKHATVISRLSRLVGNNSSFMRASPSLRSSRKFQRDIGLLAPMIYQATLAALDDFRPCYAPIDSLYGPVEDHCGSAACSRNSSANVEVRFAATEADSSVAALAEALGGYAVSQDSDYFVLCARGRNGKGYVPLDELAWEIEETGVDGGTEASADDDGFQTVKKGKTRWDPRRDPQLSSRPSRTPPPRLSSEVRLSGVRLAAYSAHALAVHLSIPASLLPLLAALVGNDYFDFGHLYFQGMSSSERIYEAARAIQNEWRKFARGDSVAGSAASGMPALDPVRQMVEFSVDALLANARSAGRRRGDGRGGSDHDFIVSGERDKVVQDIIDSVCTYSRVMAFSGTEELDEFWIGEGGVEGMATDGAHNDSGVEGDLAAWETEINSSSSSSNGVIVLAPAELLCARRQALALYLEAYKSGRLNPTLLEVMAHRIFLPKVFPEDPDRQSNNVTLARDIRRWWYAVVFSAWGLSWARGPDACREQDSDGEDPNGQTSVDEDLDALTDITTPESSVHEDEAEEKEDKPDAMVVEYVRKGERLRSEPVLIVPLEHMLSASAAEAGYGKLPEELLALMQPTRLPAPSLPESTRIAIYLHALSSRVALETVSPFLLPLVASLRHIIRGEMINAGVKRSRLWRREEVRAAVRAGLVACRWRKQATRGQAMFSPSESPNVSGPTSRAIHLSTTFQFVLDASHQLAESLLLTPAPLPASHVFYEGSIFHSILEAAVRQGSASRPPFGQYDVGVDEEEYAQVLSAVEEDLESAIFVGESKSEKKRQRKNQKISGGTSGKVALDAQGGSNAFAVLADE